MQDIVIDLTFSLETAVLVRKDEEICHRLIIYSTYIASKNFTQIMGDSELIQNAYQARSDIAHGNVKRIQDSLGKVEIMELFDLVRRVIITLLSLFTLDEFDHSTLREKIISDTVDLLEIFETIQHVAKEENEILEKLDDLLKNKKPLLIGIKKVKTTE